MAPPLSVPKHAHPLVRQLYTIARTRGASIRGIQRKAGLGHQAMTTWRYRSIPRVDNLEACLNVLGYELCIRQRRTD